MNRCGVVFSFAIACGLLAAASDSYADALNAIKQRGQLVCGTQDSNPPYSFVGPASDVVVGYDVDICAALAEGLGVALQHKGLPSDTRLKALMENRVDVIVGIVSSAPEATQSVDLSLQYLQETMNVMVMKNTGIKSLKDLSGKKICVSESARAGPVIRREFAQADVVLYRDAPTCYLYLKNGDVDAFSANDLVMNRFERQSARSAAETMILEEPFDAEHVSVAVRKGDALLLKAINDILISLERTGELDLIYEKWLGANSIFQQTRNFNVEPQQKK